MPQKQVRRNNYKTGTSGWGLALEKAETALYQNRARKGRLLAAIRFFREQIEKGVPFPTGHGLPKKE